MNLADAILWAGVAVNAPALGLLMAGVLRADPDMEHIAYGLYVVGCALSFIGNVLDGSHGWAAFWGVLAAYFAWRWWKNRRKGRGKKALKELGDKSRRRVQALVDQMTPSPIPSPSGA